MLHCSNNLTSLVNFKFVRSSSLRVNCKFNTKVTLSQIIKQNSNSLLKIILLLFKMIYTFMLSFESPIKAFFPISLETSPKQGFWMHQRLPLPTKIIPRTIYSWRSATKRSLLVFIIDAKSGLYILIFLIFWVLK